MKKFLIILITGILWCTNIYAEFIELNKCFRSEAYGPANFENKEKAKKRTTIADSWDSWLLKYIYTGEYTAEICLTDEDLEGEHVRGVKCKWRKIYKLPNDPWYADNFKKINNYEDHIFSIDTNNGSVSTIKIKNDEWIKTMLDYWTLTIGAQTEKYKKIANEHLISQSKLIEDEKIRNDYISLPLLHRLLREEDIPLSSHAQILKESSSSSDLENEKYNIFLFCPSCGFKNDNKFKFCPSCGSSLES